MQTRINGKFIQLLRTFSPEELKDFELWLNSPWANTNKNLSQLLKKLKKYAPGYDHKLLTKERLFKQVMPDKNYSNYWINNLLSLAYRQAEQFLTTRRMLADENLKADLISQEFQNKHLEAHFFKITDQKAERLEGKEIKDWEDYLELLRINRRVYHHPNQNPRMKPGSPTIVKMNENLTLVFLLEKAMIINEMIFRNRILKDENHDIQKEMKIWRTAAEGVDDLTIELYQKRFGYTEENMVEAYFKLRKVFLKKFQKLNLLNQKIHFFSLANDTNYLKKKGKLASKEVLFLYKKGLELEILPIDNEISRVTFATIVVYSNVEKDFSFSTEFIQKYTRYLPFKTFHFQKISKMLNVQAYFDLFLKDESYFSYFTNFCFAYERWILRDKRFSKNNQEPYLRFIQKSKFLAKTLLSKNFNEEKLNSFLSKESNIQGRNWLLSKRDEILHREKEKELPT